MSSVRHCTTSSSEVSQDILGEWDHISHSFNKYILINYQRCACVHTCTHENTQYAQGLVVPLRGLGLYVFCGEWVLLYPGLWGWLSSFSGSLWPSSRPGQPLYSIMRGTGAGDMANWLRALIALLDDPGSVPSNHMVTHSCNSSRGHPTCSSGLHGTRHSYGAPKHADKTPRHIIFLIKNEKRHSSKWAHAQDSWSLGT